MNNESVISDEYRQLQEALIDRQAKWREYWCDIDITGEFEKLDKSIPFAYQVVWTADGDSLAYAIDTYISILKQFRPELEENLERLSLIKDPERWVREALAVNKFYFEAISREHELPGWLPAFVAEMAVRPILQVIGERYSGHVGEMSVQAGCPCCGEPPRLAEVGKNKKKQLICPRCHTKWEEKKIACSYCGTENHEHLKVLKVEEREIEQIHVCEKCMGYTKVIQTARMLKKLDPALLDLTTLHLDYIAQENGYVQDSNSGAFS